MNTVVDCHQQNIPPQSDSCMLPALAPKVAAAYQSNSLLRQYKDDMWFLASFVDHEEASCGDTHQRQHNYSRLYTTYKWVS